MNQISPDKQLELLRWLLPTQDNQWIIKEAGISGAEEALKLFSRVRSGMGRVEMKAFLSLLGKQQASGLTEAAEIVQKYLEVVYGQKGFQGRFRVQTYPDDARLVIEVVQFNALNGLKKVAKAAGQKSGFAFEIWWACWFEALLPDKQIDIICNQVDSGPEIITITVSSPFLEQDEEESPISSVLQIPFETLTPQTASSYAAGSILNSTDAEQPSKPDLSSDVNILPPTQHSNLSGVPSSIIGLNEGNLPGEMYGGLNQRLAKARLLISDPLGKAEISGSNAVPPEALKLDPDTGRPLFMENLEEEARRNVEKSKAKKNKPLMQRLLISKEAQELLDQSEDEKPVSPFSLAAGIEAVLQRLIYSVNTKNPGIVGEPIHVIDGPEGELVILIGTTSYKSVGEVPNGPTKVLLEKAVEEWSDGQVK